MTYPLSRVRERVRVRAGGAFRFVKTTLTPALSRTREREQNRRAMTVARATMGPSIRFPLSPSVCAEERKVRRIRASSVNKR